MSESIADAARSKAKMAVESKIFSVRFSPSTLPGELKSSCLGRIRSAISFQCESKVERADSNCDCWKSISSILESVMILTPDPGSAHWRRALGLDLYVRSGALVFHVPAVLQAWRGGNPGAAGE
jgi:hypothetical protein